MKEKFLSLSDSHKGIFLVLTSVFLMAFGVIGIRWIVTIYNPSIYNMLFWSISGSSLFSLPYIFSSQNRMNEISVSLQKFPKLISIILLLSLISTAIWFFLIHSIPSDTVSLFDQSAILWGLFLGFFFLKEKTSFLQMIALFLAVVGIVLVVKGEMKITPQTLFFLICNPLLYVLQSLAMKKYGKGIDGMSLSIIRSVGMAFAFGIVFGLMGKLSFIPFYLFLLLSLTQGLAMIVAKGLYFKSHDYLPMSQINFFFLLIPIIALFVSPFIEPSFIFSLEKYIGAVLVLVGIYMFMKNK